MTHARASAQPLSRLSPAWAHRALCSLGFTRVHRGRGLLLVDRRARPLTETVADLLEERLPRVNRYWLTLTPGSAGPGQTGIPPPWPLDRIRRRFLTRHKIQAIVIAADDPAADLDSDLDLLRVAHSLGVNIVLLGLPSSGTHRQTLLGLADVVVAADEALQALDPASGPLPIRLERDDPAATARRVVDDVSRRIVSRRAPGKPGPKPADTPRRFRQLRSTEALAARLGRPRTILCLGNGPSSEDARLATTAHDVLFRVNHSWLSRGLYLLPEVIFTGQRATLRRCGARPIYAFQSQESEVKVERGAWFLMRGRFTAANAETLGIIDPTEFAPHKPSNGAVMIATAVALRPERIVVAGVDLFSDPRGAYPGDTASPNAYTLAHDRDIEADFIVRSLAGFPGEVEILGDALRSLWQSCRSRQPPQLGGESG